MKEKYSGSTGRAIDVRLLGLFVSSFTAGLALASFVCLLFEEHDIVAQWLGAASLFVGMLALAWSLMVSAQNAIECEK